jgi:hypothetical protein
MIPLRNVDIAKAFSQPGIKAGMAHQIVANEIPTKTQSFTATARKLHGYVYGLSRAIVASIYSSF